MKRILLGCAVAILLAGCVDTGTLILPSARRGAASQDGSSGGGSGSSGGSGSTTASPGLGLAGESGAVTTLAGDDLLGATLGSDGKVNELLGGTNSSSEQLAGSLAPLQPVAQAVDQVITGSVNPQLTKLSDPGLGASGENSPLTQLMGGDLVGTLIGTEGGAVPAFVAGTDGGILGTVLSPVTGSLPEGVSLAPVTTPIIDTLSAVKFPDTSGSGSSGSSSGTSGGSTSGLGGLLGTVTGALSGSGS